MKYLAFSKSALALLAPTAYKCSLHRAGVPETHSRDAKQRELGKTSQKTPVPLGIAQKQKIRTLPRSLLLKLATFHCLSDKTPSRAISLVTYITQLWTMSSRGFFIQLMSPPYVMFFLFVFLMTVEISSSWLM